MVPQVVTLGPESIEVVVPYEEPQQKVGGILSACVPDSHTGNRSPEGIEIVYAPSFRTRSIGVVWNNRETDVWVVRSYSKWD